MPSSDNIKEVGAKLSFGPSRAILRTAKSYHSRGSNDSFVPASVFLHTKEICQILQKAIVDGHLRAFSEGE